LESKGEVSRVEEVASLDWVKRPVLVTGAGGFIGSHLVERLVQEGAEVRAFVRYNSRGDTGLLRLLPPDTYSKLKVVMGNLTDAEAIRLAVRGVDTLFHLGALVSIPYSYLHPREVIETNILGTLNVLMAAREHHTRHVIHTSTSEVYGTARYTPIDEAHPVQGQSPYSASKIAADRIAESFVRTFELPVTTLRPFNTYGPRQSARAVIPTIITQALTSQEVHLGNLEPTRDFTFVSDTIEGYMQTAASENVVGEEINLGTGTMISIADLARKIFDLIGKNPSIVQEEQRYRPNTSEVMRLQASAKKAMNLLKWKPRVSLEDGLKTTINWIANHLELYKPDQYAL
jgi:dTDP-glucose 4,6-dehydratase